jgi:hypothetical protein
MASELTPMTADPILTSCHAEGCHVMHILIIGAAGMVGRKLTARWAAIRLTN